jgi:hypothetical protein
MFMHRFRAFGLPIDVSFALLEPMRALSQLRATKDSQSDGRIARALADAAPKVGEQLELLVLGISPVDHATFRYLTPIVHLNSFGDVIASYSKPTASLFATRQNAEFCMDFVLGTVARLEAVGGVRDARSRFTIRVTEACSCYTMNHGPVAEGALEAGHIIEQATFGLGPSGELEECWGWEKEGKHLLVSFRKCEIVAEHRPLDRAEGA